MQQKENASNKGGYSSLQAEVPTMSNLAAAATDNQQYYLD